jgi:hypothetical protein
VENLQRDLKRLGEWVFEKEVIINPAKSKAVCFAKSRLKESLNCSLEIYQILKRTVINI